MAQASLYFKARSRKRGPLHCRISLLEIEGAQNYQQGIY